MGKTGRFPKYFIGLAFISLAASGCTTNTKYTFGVGVCAAKTEKQKEAEQKAQAHDGLARSYRLRNDDEEARYHEVEARHENWKAVGASEWGLDAILLSLIPGNDGCDK